MNKKQRKFKLKCARYHAGHTIQYRCKDLKIGDKFKVLLTLYADSSETEPFVDEFGQYAPSVGKVETTATVVGFGLDSTCLSVLVYVDADGVVGNHRLHNAVGWKSTQHKKCGLKTENYWWCSTYSLSCGRPLIVGGCV